MSEELKPCPFCGGRAAWKQGHYTGYVMCLSCEVMGPNIDKAEAIAAWNRRPDADPPGEELRERIARIIDPWAYKQYEWSSRDDNTEALRTAICEIEAARAKADAVLSILDAARAEGRGVGACKTCGGTRRIHIVDGCTTPAHDRDCPTCVGWPIGGVGR